MAICNHQANSPLYIWSDVWSGDLQSKKNMFIHDTECPHWDPPKQPKPKPESHDILILGIMLSPGIYIRFGAWVAIVYEVKVKGGYLLIACCLAVSHRFIEINKSSFQTFKCLFVISRLHPAFVQLIAYTRSKCRMCLLRTIQCTSTKCIGINNKIDYHASIPINQ